MKSVSGYIAGLKVGWMTRTMWVTFLMGQVGLIHKLNYLDVTQIFSSYIRRNMAASVKQMNLRSTVY